jgi:hypothetical protein
METAVALLRNGLFVVKGVMPPSSWKLALEPFFSAKDLAVLALSPYHASLIVKIPLIDYAIAITQLGAAYFNTNAGTKVVPPLGCGL